MALTKIKTDGVTDDAITSGKIPANAVGSSEIADTAVTLAKLEHGTSSNDGKFLRANNGADPTFETVTGTTINNNADNRVITGSGTANTLNGESNVVIDSSGNVGIGTSAPTDYNNLAENLVVATSSDTGITVASGTSSQGSLFFADGTSGSAMVEGFVAYEHGSNFLKFGTSNAERMRIDTAGNVQIGRDKYIGTVASGQSAINIGSSGGAQIGFHQVNTNDDDIRFYTHTSGSSHAERMRIDSSGNVVINTTSGHGKLQLHDGTFVHSKPAGGGTRNWRFINNNTASGDYGIQISTTEEGSTYINHTELKAGGNVHIHDGNLVLASGHGIDFSATANTSASNASMQNELFADYEVGTWHPVIRFYNNGTWSQATMTTEGSRTGCYYVKIGNMCYFHIGWDGFEVQNSSYAVIGGLPFGSAGRGSCLVHYTNMFGNHQNQGGHISASGADQVEFYRDSNQWNSFDNNSSGKYIYACGRYKVA